MKTFIKLALVAIPVLLSPCMVSAAEGDVSFGIYGNIVGSSGEPSNDVLGIGLIGGYELKNSWFVDVELILSEADFERPWKVLGLEQDPSVATIDAVYSSTILMVQLGKNIKGGSSAFDWYWSAGLGFNSLDVDDVAGPLQGGGNFNITTDAGTETLLRVKAGIKHHLSDNWDMNYALRFDYRLADWSVTDTISGTTAKIDNYATYGILIGVLRKF